MSFQRLARTVRERHDLAQGFELETMNVGPRNGAKTMEQRLSGAEQSSFLVANDVTSNPGFPAKRGESVAVRRQFGSTGLTVSGETGSVWQQVQTSATGSPYRWSSVSVDHNFGPTSLSVGLGRLDERSSFLGGRISNALGGGGASTFFLDSEARHDFGSGWNASLTARRGWTDFNGGKFQTDAFAFDLSKRDSLETTIISPSGLPSR